MIRALLLLAILVHAIGGHDTPPEPTHWAVRYNPGVMERVSRNRKLPIVSCMLAHPTLAIGTWVEIEGITTGRKERCRVTDTSHPRDKARHIRTKRIELDYASSRRLCGSRWKGKASECPVRLTNPPPPPSRPLPTWRLE